MNLIARSITVMVTAVGFAAAWLPASVHAMSLTDESQGFFVAKTGNDSNAGTRASPFLTIQRGINAAANSSKKRVLVGLGTYQEAITLASGVKLHGNFEAGWESRSTTQSTIIAPVGLVQAAVLAKNLGTPGGTLDGFTVNAADGLGVGATSYGVLISNSPGFKVHFVTINAGKGAAGANAAPNAPNPGANGGAGGVGTNGSTSSPSAPAPGGAGGTSSCGRGGGAGGGGGYDNASGVNGTGGAGGTIAGSGGIATGQCFNKSGNGQVGGNGNNAGSAPGAGGASVTFGITTNDGIVSQTAPSGATGTGGNGGGGGGGGGGGSSGSGFCVADRGGGGGGGGAGGCGGIGGSGGMSGGNSIGIYSAISANAEVSNVFINRNNGGKGGNGQPGSGGGIGGDPGPAGTGPDDAGNGGVGGRGGNGSPGGGGGAGGGGSVVGLIAVGATVLHGNLQFAGGQVGLGGTGGAPNGASGPVGGLIGLNGPTSPLSMSDLTVNRFGTGAGSVTSDIGNIRCGSACLQTYAGNTAVELTPAPGPGSLFKGWSGVCSGAGVGACELVMNAGAVSVSAEFAAMASVAATRMAFNDTRVSDVMFRNVGTGQLFRLPLSGLSPGPGSVVYTEANLQWTVANSGDFNGDGVTDLVWKNSGNGQVYVMPFTASGAPAAGAVVHTETNPDWRIVHTPDFNGDGKADLLWWNVTTGQAFGMVMNGTSIVGQGVIHTEPDTNWKIVAIGDFAGSGKSNQLVWRHFGTGAIYLMTVQFAGGAFSQTGQVIYTESNVAWQLIAAADLDADGNSDLIWRNSGTGQVYGMLMDGTAIAEQNVIYNEPNPDWKIVAHGDYNGDGKADLLWHNQTTGQVYLVMMNGLVTAGQGMVYSEPNTSWKILGPRAFVTAAGVPMP